jgi:uncharacterized membrane protein
MDFITSGVFIAIIAHGLIGGSLLWDKVLLGTPEMKDVAPYVFWLGALSVLGLLLIPFGFHFPPLWLVCLAFVTGILHLIAIFFHYAALKAGEASQTLAIMGGFSPLATVLIGIPLLSQELSRTTWAAFALLTLGGFVMFFSEPMDAKRLLPRILIASAIYGLVNVLKKVVFDNTNFVTGYVFFTFGTFVSALLLLIPGTWRGQIFSDSAEATPRSRFWYFVNRFLSGVGSFLIYYAISLTNPAVVDAISGERYAIIFLGAYVLTRFKPVWLTEDFSRRTVLGKSAATLLIVAGLVLLGLEGNSG